MELALAEFAQNLSNIVWGADYADIAAWYGCLFNHRPQIYANQAIEGRL